MVNNQAQFQFQLMGQFQDAEPILTTRDWNVLKPGDLYAFGDRDDRRPATGNGLQNTLFMILSKELGEKNKFTLTILEIANVSSSRRKQIINLVVTPGLGMHADICINILARSDV